MNYIDLAIVIFMALMFLLGIYQGFMRSSLSFLAILISGIIAFAFSPMVSKKISSIKELNSMLLYYTEGAEKISNIELSRMEVSMLDPAQINEILLNAKLPDPLNEHFRQNLVGEVFSELGIKTVGDYSTQTIVSFSTNLLSFVIVFFAAFLILSLLITWYDYVVRLPVLTHYDGLLGGLVSIIKSVFLIYIFFMAVPVILLALPSTGSFSSQYVLDYINNSFYGSFINQTNFMIDLIKGK